MAPSSFDLEFNSDLQNKDNSPQPSSSNRLTALEFNSENETKAKTTTTIAASRHLWIQ